MSEPQPRSEQAGPDRQTQVRRVVAILIVVYVVLFVALNTERVKIRFVFFSVHTRMLVALLVVALLSFGCGYLVRGRRGRGR